MAGDKNLSRAGRFDIHIATGPRVGGATTGQNGPNENDEDNDVPQLRLRKVLQVCSFTSERERGDNRLFIILVPNVLYELFRIRWVKNLGNFC